MRFPRPLLLATLLAAIPACATLSEEDQQRLETFKYNSKRFYEDGKFDRAEDQCRKGLALDPDDASLRQVLGFALVKQGTPRALAESVAVFEVAIEEEDDFDFRNHLGLGTASFAYARHLEERERRVQIDEKLTQEEREANLNALGDQQDRAFARAEEALRAVLDHPRSRDDRTAQSLLGQLLAVTARYDEAAEVLRRLATQQGTSLRLRAEKMNVASLPPERRALFERDLDALREQQTAALTLLATVASKLERWPEVVSTYAQVEAAGGMTPADYANRARAYEALGANDAAAADYENFIRKAAVMDQYQRFGEEIAHAMERIQRLREAPRAKRP